MKISPIEIRQKTFEKNFRGYDKDEVDAFLLSLSQEWERVMDESKEIKLKLQLADKEVSKLREVESTLYKTLKTAEDTGANIVEQANKSAELLTKEAQINAEAFLNDARVRARNTQEEAEERARDVLFDAQTRLNEITLEIKGLESGKQNLVTEIQRVGNELLDRANRIANTPPLPDYSRQLMQPDTLAVPQQPAPEIQIPAQEISSSESTSYLYQEPQEEPIEQEEKIPVVSEVSKKPVSVGGSFFDLID